MGKATLGKRIFACKNLPIKKIPHCVALALQCGKNQLKAIEQVLKLPLQFSLSLL